MKLTNALPWVMVIATVVASAISSALYVKSQQNECTTIHCYTKEHHYISPLVRDNRHLFVNNFTAKSYFSFAKDDEKALTKPLLEQANNNTEKWIKPKPQHKSCAVIGNSVKLNGRGHGPAIDAHDAVFRMTYARTKGYEMDVGKHTTYMVQWAFGRRDLDDVKPIYIFYHYTSKSTLPRVFMDWLLLIAATYEKLPDEDIEKYIKNSIRFSRKANLPQNRFLMVDNAFVRGIRHVWDRNKGQKGVGAGELSIAMALHMCEQVDVYGFTTRVGENLCYYYDRGGASCRLKSDNTFKKQIKFLHTLQALKLITVHE